MIMNKLMVWSRVDGKVRFAVVIVTAHLGISISEYVRQLITADLNKRGFFTLKLSELSETLHGD